MIKSFKPEIISIAKAVMASGNSGLGNHQYNNRYSSTANKTTSATMTNVNAHNMQVSTNDIVPISPTGFQTSSSATASVPFTNGYNRWTSNSDDAESADITEIDGGIMEGGGQILRIATALSSILHKPISINRIRANRTNPGLRPQHMTGMQLVRDLCSGQLTGDQVGSQYIAFIPGMLQSGTYLADTGTAGAVSLLLQVALPCLMFTPGASHLTLRGGTNAEMAPQIDYTIQVLKPILEQFGVRMDCQIATRGYFPRGGGEVTVQASPVRQLRPINMTNFGTIRRITGRAFVAGVIPFKIAQQMAKSATSVLWRSYREVPINIQAVQEPKNAVIGNGTGIIVVAETTTGCRLSGSALGRKGIQAEQVGSDAAEMLLRNLSYGCCVDEFMQDQLIVYMSLAAGHSKIKTGPITLHTQTAMHIAQMMTQAQFNIMQASPPSTESYIIECAGIGHCNPHF
uniref:RNA 3'-terminal phosphate cyclase n=1 Tax=Phallusia mammillata TaxID=59560 RepID=A0A6F9DSE2_9ASCI|nr:RNA 3'-terminal phosphate cyclase-like [Phallusia mammillata]